MSKRSNAQQPHFQTTSHIPPAPDASGVIERINAMPETEYLSIEQEIGGFVPAFIARDLQALAHRLADAERLVERYEKFAAEVLSFRLPNGDVLMRGTMPDTGRYWLDTASGETFYFDSALDAFEAQVSDKGE